MSFNTDGFRDRDYTKVKPPGVFRILVLGNSATFGVSVSSPQTYVKQVEELLNKGDSDKKFEAMNYGVPSWNILYQENYLRKMALQYNPDMVIIGFTLNGAEGFYHPPDDLFSSAVSYQGNPDVLHRSPKEWAKPLIEHRSQESRSRLDALTGDLKIGLSNHCALYRYALWRYDLTKQPFGSQDYPASLYYQEASQHWEPCKSALGLIQQTLAERKIPGVVMIFPLFFRLKPGPGLNESYPWRDIHRLVGSATTNTGMTTIDLLPVFEGWDPRTISVDPYHMNPTGHRMAAEALYSQLKSHQLIPSTEP